MLLDSKYPRIMRLLPLPTPKRDPSAFQLVQRAARSRSLKITKEGVHLVPSRLYTITFLSCPQLIIRFVVGFQSNPATCCVCSSITCISFHLDISFSLLVSYIRISLLLFGAIQMTLSEQKNTFPVFTPCTRYYPIL